MVLLMLLCACSGERQVTPVTRGISFTAVIRYYNESYECEVEVDDECCAVVKLTEPADLSGLKFICKGESLTAEYLGLSYTPDVESMPSGAVVKTVYGILRDCSADNASAEEEDGNYSFHGKVDDCAYTVMLAPSGLPLSAQIPDESYTVEFKNVTVGNNKNN